ncbi:hypothetical protein [Desulfoluna sp.]|uniref:hypothetical protein n=1 Tax=Desulfoluna sp. TaxID=2045199 RepID=UPI002619B34C|nr:hypothetical protein [Desulfoluna sp.]
MRFLFVLLIATLLSYTAAFFAKRHFGMGRAIGWLVFVGVIFTSEAVIFKDSGMFGGRAAAGNDASSFLSEPLWDLLRTGDAEMYHELRLYQREYLQGKMPKEFLVEISSRDVSAYFLTCARRAPAEALRSYFVTLQAEIADCQGSAECDCEEIIASRREVHGEFLVYPNGELRQAYEAAIADVIRASRDNPSPPQAADDYAVILDSFLADPRYDFGENRIKFEQFVLGHRYYAAPQVICDTFFQFQEAALDEMEGFGNKIIKGFFTMKRIPGM